MKKIKISILILISLFLFLQISFAKTEDVIYEEILFDKIQNAKSNNVKLKTMKQLFDHYLRTNDYDDIIAISDELLSFDLSNKEKYKIYYNVSKAYLQLNEPASAAEYAKEATEIYPSKIEPKLLLATIYTQNNLYELAIVEFKKIVDLNKNNVEALVNLGNIYKNLENYKLALSYYQQAIDTKKIEDKQIYINSAISAKEIGLTTKAINYLIAVPNYTKDASICILLSRLYGVNGDIQKAKDLLIPLVQNDNSNLEICLQLASLYILSKEYEKSKNILLDFENKNEIKNIEALDLLLAEVYSKLSEKQKAISIITNITNYTSSQFVKDSLSNLLILLEKE